jgi:hypothetical protein
MQGAPKGRLSAELMGKIAVPPLTRGRGSEFWNGSWEAAALNRHQGDPARGIRGEGWLIAKNADVQPGPDKRACEHLQCRGIAGWGLQYGAFQQTKEGNKISEHGASGSLIKAESWISPWNWRPSWRSEIVGNRLAYSSRDELQMVLTFFMEYISQNRGGDRDQGDCAGPA